MQEIDTLNFRTSNMLACILKSGVNMQAPAKFSKIKKSDVKRVSPVPLICKKLRYKIIIDVLS